MAKDLDKRSSNILNFRPVIDFVEPEQEEVAPDPIRPVEDDADFEKRREKLSNLANSVEVLAAAVQARVDQRAAFICIRLDPVVDAVVIDAVKRQFPDVPFTVTETEEDGPFEDGFCISYEMYKQCRENIMNYGCANALNAEPTEAEIEDARRNLNAPMLINTKAAKDGSFRPELSNKATIVKSPNTPKFRNYIIRVLVNYIWKNYILKFAFAGVPNIPGVGKLQDMLPQELASVPKSFKKQLKKAKKKGVDVLGG